MSAACLPAAPSALLSARSHHAHGELLAAAEDYRLALASEPRSRDALLGLSLVARQTNQTLPALRMAEAALAAEPVTGATGALAWANYGDCLFAFDRMAAEAAFRTAIRLDGDLAAAHYGLGNILALEDNFRDALVCFQSAIRSTPRIPEFHFAEAFALGKLGRHGEAINAYRRAVKLKPGLASAWLNLGVELIADGQIAIAMLCYRQAIGCSAGEDPPRVHTRISAAINLGNLERSRRRFAQAEQHYSDALRLTTNGHPDGHPRLAEVHVAFAYLHLEQEKFSPAWRSLELASECAPEIASRALGAREQAAEIANARGILLLAEQSSNAACASGLQEELLQSAMEAFALAESLGHRSAASNRGNALLRLGRVEEAIRAHQIALNLDPYHPGIRHNLALTQLRAGRFAEGWRNYEIRWQFREVHPNPRRFPQPRWLGEPLNSTATLLLYAEQGLGDTLQFLRYLRLVMQRAPEAGIVLEVQAPLVRLVRASVSRCVRGDSARAVVVIAHGDSLPALTHHCPLMSLPMVFETRVDTVPAPMPVWAVDDEAARRCCRELECAGGERRLRVGIHWAGNPAYRADRERSTRLASFLPLLRNPEVLWVSLQKGQAADQIAQVRGSMPEDCCLYDGCSGDLDLADTADLMSSLDLVITTDSVIAHLAGCMGKPLWLLLPWQSDWRWMQEIATTPWYPEARLFRQSAPQDWAGLIDRVSRELEVFLKEKSGQAVA